MKRVFISFLIIISNIILAFGSITEEPEIKIDNISISENKIIVETNYKIPKNFYQNSSSEFLSVTTKDKRLELIKTQIQNPNKKLTNSFNITSTFLIKNKINKEETKLTFDANYQLCSKDGACIPPNTQQIESELKITEDINPKAWKKTLLYILFAFIGGIILNIMPCVLPVLSIKAFSLVKQNELSKKQIFNNSLLYSLGIILSLLILAIVAIIIKTAGKSIGWGFQFQNPGFVMFLITILYIFSFAMFDFIVISISNIKTHSYKSKYAESFFTGVLAVLLSTPCTAPFLGTALGFAFSQPAIIILLIFLAIALGLSFPFLLIGIFPKSLKILPKPGNWMNTFKEIMGFLLILTSIWLLSVLHSQIDTKSFFNFLYFILIITFAMWIFRNFYNRGKTKKTRIISIIVILAIIITSGVFLIKTEKPSTNINNQATTDNRIIFNENEVERDIKNGEKIFIIFSAKWCLTCQTNEKNVLKTKTAIQHFEKNNIKVYYGDYTNNSETITKWLNKYNRSGVPLYLYFNGETEEPQILSELITKKMILNLK